MKKEILTMTMELKAEGNKLNVQFGTELKGRIAELISDEQEERVGALIHELTKVLNEVIIDDFENKVKEKIEEENKEVDEVERIQKKLYDAMPEDCKKEVDEFEKELEGIESNEERAEFIFNKIMGSLANLVDAIGDNK